MFPRTQNQWICSQRGIGGQLTRGHVLRIKLRTGAVISICFIFSGNVETIVLLSNRNLREKEHLKVEIDMEDYRKVKEN